MNLDLSNPYIFIDDITNGQENVQISLVNTKNSQNPLKSITYFPNNILGSTSLVEDFESIQMPCTCKNSCESNCSCSLGSSIAYHKGVLSEQYFNHISKPIIECSTLCICKNCPSRVVQNGIKIHLQVFMTEHKGFGVRTLEFIPKYAFICEYAGELIDKDEAHERMKNLRKEDPNYIYILNECISENSSSCTIIDPTYFGNVGRYLNHSCSPNLIPVPVRANSMIPRICFFAKKDIELYEELTYNYGRNIKQENDFKVDKKKCYCNSIDCIGVLPFDKAWLC